MNTLRGRILALMVMSVLLFTGVALFFQSRALDKRMDEIALGNLETFVETAAVVLESGSLEDLEEQIARLSDISSCRVTLVDAEGTVLGDSSADPRELDNHKNRPEIAGAFQDGEGTAHRYSRSLNTHMLYSARRITVEELPLAVRFSYSRDQVDAVVDAGRHSLFLALIPGAVLLLLLGFWGAGRLARPLQELADSVRTERPVPLSQGGIFGVTREAEELARGLRDFLEKRKNAETVLREERGWLQLILNSLPLGVLVVNTNGEVRYSNPPLDLLLRRKARSGDLVQGLLREPEMVVCVEEALRGISGSRSVTLRDEEETRIQVHGAPAEYGAVAVFQDVTERYRFEESRKAFVADAGHEFQTPLTVIRGSAELLYEKASSEDRRYIQRILDQQERMTGLVDDLLLLSRLEAEKDLGAHEKEEVDLGDIARVAVNGAQAHPLGEALEWTVEIAEEAPFFGWREGLLRCMGNLLENAVKYTRERFGEAAGGHVGVVLKRDGDFWAFTVRDNGVGVPQNLKNLIFERFQRGDASRTRNGWGKGGYGLGLAIVRRMAELHRGSVRLDETEEGSSFTLLFPGDTL